ncbi:hypothetical protein BH09ACT1_BH09ACT1_11730 [soil metagenome]
MKLVRDDPPLWAGIGTLFFGILGIALGCVILSEPNLAKRTDRFDLPLWVIGVAGLIAGLALAGLGIRALVVYRRNH